MEKKELDEKILEVSQTILSYCIAHTSNQYDAEDLAQFREKHDPIIESKFRV